MSQEKLQTMSMQNFGGVKEVHYGIVQVVNYVFFYGSFPIMPKIPEISVGNQMERFVSVSSDRNN